MGNKVSLISGHAHLVPHIRKSMGVLYGKRKVSDVDKMIDDLVGVDALAQLMTEAIETTQAKDGRVDMRDAAAYVLARMKESPR